jgi:DNA invertase Pin-like site-specific DNA recombinase
VTRDCVLVRPLLLLAVRNFKRGAYTKNPCVTEPNKPCEIRADLVTSIYYGTGDLGREIIMKRVALYIRVSTSKQDTENQRRELEAVADRSGWKIVKVYEDAGISGAKGRDQRPGLDAMMKAVNAKEFDMVATWSVDRLGRSLTDLLGILQGLHEKGVGLFLHQQGLDTSTTAGKAMFQMLGVFAEFERGIIRERVNAGLARARANGTKLGRRPVKPAVEARILELKAGGDGMLKIGRKLGIGTSVVQRVVKQTAAHPEQGSARFT